MDMYKDSRNKSERVTDAPENAVVGRNAVTELLKSGRSVDKLFIAEGSRGGNTRRAGKARKVRRTFRRGKSSGRGRAHCGR